MHAMDMIEIVLITFLPFLELRASIPYGILVLKESPFLVFTIACITNIILGIVLYPFIDTIVRIVRKIGFLDKIYLRYVDKTQKKITKLVNRYGELGVAIFIGIPLPGSGVYSGSVAAYLIGLKYKKFIISSIIGVLIAGTIVTVIVLSGSSAFELFVKQI